MPWVHDESEASRWKVVHRAVGALCHHNGTRHTKRGPSAAEAQTRTFTNVHQATISIEDEPVFKLHKRASIKDIY
jgi:hypothetical protein